MDTKATATFLVILGMCGFFLYNQGYLHGLASIPSAFQPRFDDEEFGSDACYLMAERVDQRLVYVGCFTAAAIEDQRRYAMPGLGLPPRVVIAQFDRSMDDL